MGEGIDRKERKRAMLHAQLDYILMLAEIVAKNPDKKWGQVDDSDPQVAMIEDMNGMPVNCVLALRIGRLNQQLFGIDYMMDSY